MCRHRRADRSQEQGLHRTATAGAEHDHLRLACEIEQDSAWIAWDGQWLDIQERVVGPCRHDGSRGALDIALAHRHRDEATTFPPRLVSGPAHGSLCVR
ncbi:hypothetical protein JCM18899A_40980 [Nocardioides sp. AN3]